MWARKQGVGEVVLHMLVGQMQRTVVCLLRLVSWSKGPSDESEETQMRTIDAAGLEASA